MKSRSSNEEETRDRETREASQLPLLPPVHIQEGLEGDFSF